MAHGGRVPQEKEFLRSRRIDGWLVLSNHQKKRTCVTCSIPHFQRAQEDGTRVPGFFLIVSGSPDTGMQPSWSNEKDPPAEYSGAGLSRSFLCLGKNCYRPRRIRCLCQDSAPEPSRSVVNPFQSYRSVLLLIFSPLPSLVQSLSYRLFWYPVFWDRVFSSSQPSGYHLLFL